MCSILPCPESWVTGGSLVRVICLGRNVISQRLLAMPRERREAASRAC